MEILIFDIRMFDYVWTPQPIEKRAGVMYSTPHYRNKLWSTHPVAT